MIPRRNQQSRTSTIASFALLAPLALVATARPAIAEDDEEFRTLRVGIVVFEGVELLDFAGPAEVFASAGHQLEIDERPLFEVVTVAPTRDAVLAHGGVTILPCYAIADRPRLDLVLIPGGEVGDLQRNPAFADWLRATAPELEILMSVCNGAYVLADLGFLDRYDPTAFHSAEDAVHVRAMQGKVLAGRRVVDGGDLVVTGSVSCGIDGALHVVARLGGRRIADAVASYMQYRWQPEPHLEGTYSDWASVGGLRVELHQQIGAHRQARDWKALERASRDLTELEPENATAWFHLGYALLSSGQFDEAVDACEEAARDPKWRPSALFNAAIGRAHLGESAAALETLGSAVDAGFARRDLVDADRGFDPLRSDPRFQALLARMDASRTAVEGDGWAAEQLGRGRRWLARGEPDEAVRSLLAAMDSDVPATPLRALLQSACTSPKSSADDATAKARRWLAAHPWPTRVVLAAADEPGERMVVSGVVRDPSGRPLAGAKLHLFHADAKGHYRPEHAMDEPRARLNGWIVTGADGRYELESVRPGGYPKPRGDLGADAGDQRWIPQHVHFEVSAPGRASRSFQLVFEDDPRMTPWWRKWAVEGRHPVIALARDGAGPLVGRCDVTLE